MVTSPNSFAYTLIAAASLISLTQYLTSTALPAVERAVLTTRVDQLEKTYTMSSATTQSLQSAGQDVLSDLYVNKQVSPTLPTVPYKGGRFTISFNSSTEPTRISLGYGNSCSVFFPGQGKEPIYVTGHVGEKGRCVILDK